MSTDSTNRTGMPLTAIAQSFAGWYFSRRVGVISSSQYWEKSTKHHRMLANIKSWVFSLTLTWRFRVFQGAANLKSMVLLTFPKSPEAYTRLKSLVDRQLRRNSQSHHSKTAVISPCCICLNHSAVTESWRGSALWSAACYNLERHELFISSFLHRSVLSVEVTCQGLIGRMWWWVMYQWMKIFSVRPPINIKLQPTTLLFSASTSLGGKYILLITNAIILKLIVLRLARNVSTTYCSGCPYSDLQIG